MNNMEDLLSIKYKNEKNIDVYIEISIKEEDIFSFFAKRISIALCAISDIIEEKQREDNRIKRIGHIKLIKMDGYQACLSQKIGIIDEEDLKPKAKLFYEMIKGTPKFCRA